MKKIKQLSIFFLFFVVLPVYSLDLSLGIQADNFAFLDDGNILAKTPDFGFDVEISSELTNIIGANFKIQRTPVMGNMLKPRIIFSTTSVMFSFGPSIAILNKAHKQKELSHTFQPGFGVGMDILTEKGFLARFDIDFSIFTGISKTNIYLNNGEFEVGMRAPHTFVSLKFEQLTRTSTIEGETSSGLTDASLNFEVFSKPSQFVFPVSFIARISKYKNSIDANRDIKFLSIVLRAGLKHNIYNDLSYYVTGEFPVYDVKLKGNLTTTTRYKIKAGFGISFN